MKFILIAIAVWVCAMVIWWVCWNASRRQDLDRLKSRLLGTSKKKKTKAAPQNAPLIQADETGGLLATRLLQRYRLQSKFQELLEQAGLKWSTHRLVNTSLLAAVAGWAVAWIMLPATLQRFAYVALLAGAFPLLYVLRKRKARLRRFEELFPESLEFLPQSLPPGPSFSV